MSPLTRFFHPVLAAQELRTGPVRVQVANEAFVLFRDREGRAAAFVDACPHRKAPLSAGRVRADGRLQCAYHGWHFDADGRGASPSQPSLKRCDATVMQLLERDGYLWLAAPGVSASTCPPTTWDDFQAAGVFSMLFEAPLHVALDNFSEDEHTPWVHTRLGWDERHVETIDFTAVNHDDHTQVAYRARQRDTMFRFAMGMRKGDTFNNEWITRFDPVRTIYDIFWSDPKSGESRGVTTRSVIFMVPETDRTTRFHVFVNTRVTKRRYRLLSPVLNKLAVALAWWEIRDDRRFIPTVADTPDDMKGMRLGKYDKPLVHNHKLLRRIYWATEDNVRSLRRAE